MVALVGEGAALGRNHPHRFPGRRPSLQPTGPMVYGHEAGRLGPRRTPSTATTHAVRGTTWVVRGDPTRSSLGRPMPFRGTELLVRGDAADRSCRRRKAFTATPRLVPADAMDRPSRRPAPSPATTDVVPGDGPRRLLHDALRPSRELRLPRSMPPLERPVAPPHGARALALRGSAALLHEVERPGASNLALRATDAMQPATPPDSPLLLATLAESTSPLGETLIRMTMRPDWVGSFSRPFW